MTRRWMRSALLGLSVGAGMSGPSRAELPDAALTLVRGRGSAEDRLLLLPVRPVAGLRYQPERLERLVPGLHGRLLENFFTLDERPEPSLPGGLREVGLLFGRGGGVFRLAGREAAPALDRMLEELGYGLLPIGEAVAFEGPEAWGWRQGGLLYGAWGPRPSRMCLTGLDGRGRRVYRVEGPRRGEVLSVWRRGEELGSADLRAVLDEGVLDHPYPLRRVGLDVRVPRSRSPVLRVRVRLVPRSAEDLSLVAEWVRIVWLEPEHAEVRVQGPAVSVSWTEPEEDVRVRLSMWGEDFLAWMSGDAYRELQ